MSAKLTLVLFLRFSGVVPWLAHAAPTHILTVIADDLGWANVGFHQDAEHAQNATPAIDALVREGINLERHYAFKICSPSRCSFQSGRLPVHVNEENADPLTWNPADSEGGYAGIPPNMTGIAEILRDRGYRTHMIGKWDAGMASKRQTPLSRGYESFLGYFHHANDYYTCGLGLTAVGQIDTCSNAYIDLWDGDGPAYGLNGTAYEEELFTTRSLSIIADHDPSEPLFLVHAFHIVHTPLQVPAEYTEMFASIDYENRRKYTAMVKYMDDVIALLVAGLQDKGMWSNTLLVFFSDNGGPIYNPGSANNHPLRGGKYADFEGGVRTVAFASGGAVPSQMRGTRLDSLIHVADWYATFAGIASANATDVRAAASGLPAVDGLDQWPILSGMARSAPRTELHLSDQAFIQGKYKLVTGSQVMSGWTGPIYPNATGQQPLFPDLPNFPPIRSWSYECGRGCLFDVFEDPTEHADIASEHPDIVERMVLRLEELNDSRFRPDRGTEDPKGCEAAVQYGGYYGPFLDMDEPSPGDDDAPSRFWRSSVFVPTVIGCLLLLLAMVIGCLWWRGSGRRVAESSSARPLTTSMQPRDPAA